MRKYEFMTIFPTEENHFKAGLAQVKQVISEYGVEIEKEEPFGDRELCYEIKKQRRGRFTLLVIAANPAKISEIDKRLKLNVDILKYMFVRVDT
jgi:small subunit ribosomal protein S6